MLRLCLILALLLVPMQRLSAAADTGCGAMAEQFAAVHADMDWDGSDCGGDSGQCPHVLDLPLPATQPGVACAPAAGRLAFRSVAHLQPPPGRIDRPPCV